MIGNYSISLLIRAFNVQNDKALNHFEQVIVLWHFPEKITEKELIERVKKENKLEAYETAVGTHIYWEAVKVLDVFEVMSKVEFEQNAEVYSRHFVEEIDLDEIIAKYFSDLVWEDTI